ncbi:hypothetical protein MG293_001414 [Ovis ammon polii]|uniref:Uncharacterized protein n=1 Tax=Ovis ammon polii TaxID=230172 RepID=A0AAD4YI14_OVIAM|nr:hypothetical protein MG293_001414 [Ovis ammon polii]
MSEQLQGNVMLASGFHSLLHNGQVSLVHMLFPSSLSTVLSGIVSSTFDLVEHMLSGRKCVVDVGSSLSNRVLPEAREKKELPTGELLTVLSSALPCTAVINFPQIKSWQVDCSPRSTGFSRQEYWNGLPFPSPRDLPNPGIKSMSMGVTKELDMT